MKRIVIFYFFILLAIFCKAQPVYVNNDFYAKVMSSAYDSVNRKVFFNLLHGCTTWTVPCAENYSLFAQFNLINKHDYTDNDLLTCLGSKTQTDAPQYAINNFNSGVAKQTKHHEGFVYTNFGYYFNKINDNLNPVTVWSYSPSANPTYKEISSFEIKSDSVFFFQKDSVSGQNFYSILVKNKLTGNTIPYNSILESAPTSSLGCINGYVNASVLVNNKILLGGVFTASVSGAFISRNLVYLDIASGQLMAPPITFTAGSSIYDMKLHNNKIHIAGQFAKVNNRFRNNYAVLDYNFTLAQDSCYFNGDFMNNTYVDKIAFYDKYMIAKGNFWAVAGQQFDIWANQYVIKVVDRSVNALKTWTIDMPAPFCQDQMMDLHRNKLYIHNRDNNSSPFEIYCFPPVNTSTLILFPGSNLPAPSNSVQLCTPDNGLSNIFIAPIRYADNFIWNYSGTNATLVPLGDGSTAKLITATNSTNGTLTVTGYNDCGLSSQTASLNVFMSPKPLFTLPISPQNLICNPDSTLLQATSSNTNAVLKWRKTISTTYTTQPYYTKTSGNFYMVIKDNSNLCKDSGLVQVNNLQIGPNAKIISHVYPGPAIPIDTVTCLQPTVNIVGGSDTAGVVVTWKSIATNSISSNPISLIAQNNLKLIITRSVNNCVDSSLIVLVGQDNSLPNISINNYSPGINCSIYTVNINAIYSPTNCNATWTGPLSFTSANPANTSALGKYYLNVLNSSNGCTKVDSVNVIQTNSLVLKTSNDTLVCKSSFLNLNAIAIGTLGGVTYSWNSGANGNSISVNPNSTTNFIVFANGPGGCAGKDTIKVKIPSDITDSIATVRNCDGSPFGSIIIFSKGGIAPYKYSLNAAPFLANSTFTGLPFSTYTVNIRDSIGCIRSTTVSLNANTDLPVPKFLASTNNFKSDTIVLVDISIPKADSVQWVLPSQAVKIGGDNFNPIIFLSDTGTFVFTMRGYYGTCVINATKNIRFSPLDSTQANHYNANGIKTVLLYPNPNSGQFTVQIEFYKKQDASIQVWNTAANKFLQENFYNVEAITLPVNLNTLQNGAYILRVIGEFDSKYKTFTITH
jgi:hypothetical protein